MLWTDLAQRHIMRALYSSEETNTTTATTTTITTTTTTTATTSSSSITTKVLLVLVGIAGAGAVTVACVLKSTEDSIDGK